MTIVAYGYGISAGGSGPGVDRIVKPATVTLTSRRNSVSLSSRAKSVSLTSRHFSVVYTPQIGVSLTPRSFTVTKTNRKSVT